MNGVRFDEKSRENLEAVERLLPDEDFHEALFNAAASRAYYAAYLAIADRAQQLYRGFTGEKATYYRHDTLADDAVAWGIIDHDLGDRLRWLYTTRIKADYYEDQVTLEEASRALDLARSVVTTVLGDA